MTLLQDKLKSRREKKNDLSEASQPVGGGASTGLNPFFFFLIPHPLLFGLSRHVSARASMFAWLGGPGTLELVHEVP